MNRESYIKMTDTVNESKLLRYGVIVCDSIISKIAYMAYPGLLIWLAVSRNPELIKALAVPGISFVLLSIFRYLYNAPRPYEKFEYRPVIDKKTKGRSMPSRHVFSMFMIAVTIFYFLHAAGILFAAAGVLMAAARVLGGVHSPADVAVGAAVGIICGIIGFYIIF